MTALAFVFVLFGAPAASPSLTPSANADAPGPAGCVIRVDQRMVLVKDVWSYRWSIPGGGAEGSETRRQTAERETFEELGLHVTAGRQLASVGGDFYAFECSPAEPLELLDGSILVLPDEARLEISVASLMTPSTLAKDSLRFPSQQESMAAWSEQATPLEPSWLHIAQPARPALFDGEMQANRALQTLASPAADAVFGLFSGFGTLTTAAVIVVALWYFLGWRAGVEMLLFVALATVAANTAKEWLHLPRPCYLDATLCRESVSSFGCPSGHSVLAASLAGLLLMQTRLRSWWPVLVTAVVGCGAARLYWGAHFLHDVLAAWMLVGGGLAAYKLTLRRLGSDVLPWRVWCALFVTLGAGSLALAVQPVVVMMLALTLGLGSGLLLCQAWHWPAAAQLWSGPTDGRWLAALPRVVAALIATALLRTATHALAPVEATFVASLTYLVASYFALGLLLPLLHRVLGKRR